MKKTNSVREVALACLLQLEESDKSISEVVDRAICRSELSPSDRGLLNELVYGITRWRKQIDWMLRQFVNPRFQLDKRMRNLLRLGAYQLVHLDKIPPHAAIYETVELAKPKGKTAGFVNGVLRAVQRGADGLEYPALESQPSEHIATSLSYPLELVERWLARRGVEWTLKFCRASNQVAPLSIRVNTLRTNRADLIRSLAADGALAVESRLVPEGLRLSVSVPCTSLAAFKNGLFYVQDESAMLVAHLLQPQPNMKIVDLCAAPGGKTTHIAQLMAGTGELIAVDVSEEKNRLIAENCRRLDVINVGHCKVDLMNASLEFVMDADAVLLDAPCSGLGTLRRHPDIRWNKTSKQISELTRLQLGILNNVASHIKPGGIIVYSTCSTEPEENEEIVHRFLGTHPRFVIEKAENILPFVPRNVISPEGFLQTFPHEHGIDGAFAARFRAEI